jgi:hypothetical protein
MVTLGNVNGSPNDANSGLLFTVSPPAGSGFQLALTVSPGIQA